MTCMVCSKWSWFRGRFVVSFSSGERFVNKFPPPSLLRNNHGLRKLAQTSLQRPRGIMVGRVSISLLNYLTKGNIIFKNKNCLRRSVVLISRSHVRSLSRSNISAAQLDLSSHLAGKTYADLYELSIRDPETFWGSIAKERLAWSKPFDQVTDCDLSSGKINWFLGGQLNVSGECHTWYIVENPPLVNMLYKRFVFIWTKGYECTLTWMRRQYKHFHMLLCKCIKKNVLYCKQYA